MNEAATEQSSPDPLTAGGKVVVTYYDFRNDMSQAELNADSPSRAAALRQRRQLGH
ncbi:MAG: hypothetical protein U1E14_08430 [Geminicoccaceae bacterium]